MRRPWGLAGVDAEMATVQDSKALGFSGLGVEPDQSVFEETVELGKRAGVRDVRDTGTH